MTLARERRLYAEYEITTGRRGLYAQRIDGHIALTDAPIDDKGRGLSRRAARRVAR